MEGKEYWIELELTDSLIFVTLIEIMYDQILTTTNLKIRS